MTNRTMTRGAPASHNNQLANVAAMTATQAKDEQTEKKTAKTETGREVDRSVEQPRR